MGGCSARVQRGKGKEGDQRQNYQEAGLGTSRVKRNWACTRVQAGKGKEGDKRQNEKRVGLRTQDMLILSQRTFFMKIAKTLPSLDASHAGIRPFAAQRRASSGITQATLRWPSSEARRLIMSPIPMHSSPVGSMLLLQQQSFKLFASALSFTVPPGSRRISTLPCFERSEGDVTAT